MKITTFERQKSCFDIVYAQKPAQLHLLINYIDVQRERELRKMLLHFKLALEYETERMQQNCNFGAAA
jgi:hypothetical protein